LFQISLPWQKCSVQKKCNWQHSTAHFRKLFYGRKNFAKIFYASRFVAHFVPNFVAMATGVSREKMQFSAFDDASLKTFLEAQRSRENFLRKLIYSAFCPKFCCHGKGGLSEKNAIFAFDGAFLKTFDKRKNFAKISYASRVIAHFVPNFVAMAKGVLDVAGGYNSRPNLTR